MPFNSDNREKKAKNIKASPGKFRNFKIKKGQTRQVINKKNIEPQINPVIEYKFLQYLMDNKIPLEAKFIEGLEFTGRIQWFSEWLTGFRVDGRENIVVFNRLMMIYYTVPGEYNISEREINNLFWLKINDIVLDKLKDEITPYEFKVLSRLNENFFSEKKLSEMLKKFNFNFNSIDIIIKNALKIYTPEFVGVEAEFLKRLKDNKVPLTFYLNNNVFIKGYLEWAEKLIYHIRDIENNEIYNIYKDSIVYFEEGQKIEEKNRDKKADKKRKSKKKRMKKR